MMGFLYLFIARRVVCGTRSDERNIGKERRGEARREGEEKGKRKGEYLTGEDLTGKDMMGEERIL